MDMHQVVELSADKNADKAIATISSMSTQAQNRAQNVELSNGKKIVSVEVYSSQCEVYS